MRPLITLRSRMRARGIGVSLAVQAEPRIVVVGAGLEAVGPTGLATPGACGAFVFAVSGRSGRPDAKATTARDKSTGTTPETRQAFINFSTFFAARYDTR